MTVHWIIGGVWSAWRRHGTAKSKQAKSFKMPTSTVQKRWTLAHCDRLHDG